MTTILYLMRHGETEYNRERRWQGSLDIPLNQKGYHQAEKAAKEFSLKALAAIYTSPLQRAYETGKIIGKEKNLFPSPFPELSEQNFGQLEGVLIEESVAIYDSIFRKFRATPATEQLGFKIVEDMESSREVVDRVIPFLKRVATVHKGEEILLVTHGGVIKSLMMLLYQEDWFSFHIANCQALPFIYQVEKEEMAIFIS